MNPTNSSLNKETCVSTSSNCVVWNGSDLPCIDLCNGDSISDVTYKLAVKVCDFIDTFNYNDLDLDCIFEPCDACPQPEKTLRNIIELIITKVCALDEAIDNLEPNPEVETSVFNINLSCLAVTDGFGNILNNNTNDQIIQSIIDQVCENKANIFTLTSEVDDHEDRITVLENASSSIPQVTSDCVFVGTKDIDNAFELLDADYCLYKDAIGSTIDIEAAVAQQCDLPALVGNPSFILNPVNLAESFNNLWLAYCNVLARLTLIEDTCCAPSCDDIKIGFRTVFNDDSTVTLEFNAGTGTTIPAGWTDCGSTLTISDDYGNSTTVSLTIVNNYTSDDIDLSGFTKGVTLTFSLDVKMCSGDITCQKCVIKTAQYSNADCCAVTNTGDEPVTIIYTTPLNPLT